MRWNIQFSRWSGEWPSDAKGITVHLPLMPSQSPSSKYLRSQKPWLLYPLFLFYCLWWCYIAFKPCWPIRVSSTASQLLYLLRWGRIQNRGSLDFVLEEPSNSKFYQGCFSYIPKPELRKGVLKIVTSLRARCSPAGGAEAAASAGCGSAGGCARLTLPSPGDSRAASAPLTALSLIHENAVPQRDSMQFLFVFLYKRPSVVPLGRKILKCTKYPSVSNSRALQGAATPFFSILGLFGIYLFWGGTSCFNMFVL